VSWLTGRRDERLIYAAECTDRGEFGAAARTLRDTTIGVGSYNYATGHAADAAGRPANGKAAGRSASYAALYASTYALTAREQCARRARELLIPDAPDARILRLAVAAHIESRPELHDQGQWGNGSADPSCSTPCCVAGRSCHLGGGSRGLPVELAAMALLSTDDAPLPSFYAMAHRSDIMRALRIAGTPKR